MERIPTLGQERPIRGGWAFRAPTSPLVAKFWYPAFDNDVLVIVFRRTLTTMDSFKPSCHLKSSSQTRENAIRDSRTSQVAQEFPAILVSISMEEWE
jgi:hypothetical protein